MFDWLRFFLFEEHNTRMVALGCVVIGANAGVAGTFTFLRKNALVGDLIAHSLLPGVAIAFLLNQNKDTGLLLLGAIIAGMIALLKLEWLAEKTRLKRDTLMAVILSIFLAFGLMLFTVIQQSEAGNQSGLDRFLFGKAASMSIRDVRIFSVLATVNLCLVVLFLNPLRMLAFNADYGRSLGMPVSFYRNLLSGITVVSIAAGIQAVGVVLMSALFIIPAIAGRFFTNRLEWLLVFAGLAGAISGLSGAWVSYINGAMPTGPWIVISLAVITFGAVLFAPRFGIMSIYRQKQQMRHKVNRENVLKILHESQSPFTSGEISFYAGISGNHLKQILKKLKRSGLVNENAGKFWLSTTGEQEAKRITKMHCLWEIYLSKRLNLSLELAHDGAEAMEHLLSEDIEQKLMREVEGNKQEGGW